MKYVQTLLIILFFVKSIIAQNPNYVNDIATKYEVVNKQLPRNFYFDGLFQTYNNFSLTGKQFDTYYLQSFLTSQTYMKGSEKLLFGKSEISERQVYREYITYESQLRYFDVENDEFVPCQSFCKLLAYKDDYENELEKIKTEFTFNPTTKNYEGSSKLKIGLKKVIITPILWTTNLPDRTLLRGFKILILG